MTLKELEKMGAITPMHRNALNNANQKLGTVKRSHTKDCKSHLPNGYPIL